MRQYLLLSATFVLGATITIAGVSISRTNTLVAQDTLLTPRSQPGTDMTIYSPKLHGLYDGKFHLTCGRTYVVGSLSDTEGWEHIDNAGQNSHLVEGTVEIDVDEINNTGTFIAKLQLPEGLFELTLDRFSESIPCQDGGVASMIFEHGDSGCGNTIWPKTLLYIAGWGTGSATLNGKPLYTDYQAHFMVTQGKLPTDSDLFRTLTRGMYGSTMPSFRHLSERDRWSLVQFVKSLANYYDEFEETVVNLFNPRSPQAIGQAVGLGTEPPATLKSVTRGRILFIEQGCVSCHQEKKAQPVGLGRWEGNFNWYDEMNRPIQHSRDLTAGVFRAGAADSDVFRIISGGPNVGPMPNYLKLPVDDRWALVHYVRSVHKPDYPQAPASADDEAHWPTRQP